MNTEKSLGVSFSELSKHGVWPFTTVHLLQSICAKVNIFGNCFGGADSSTLHLSFISCDWILREFFAPLIVFFLFILRLFNFLITSLSAAVLVTVSITGLFFI